PGAGRGEDPVPARAVRPEPVPAAVQRRHPPTPRGHARDRVARHRGRAPRARRNRHDPRRGGTRRRVLRHHHNRGSSLMGTAAAVHTVAVLGVGRVGTAIARALLDAGYRVLVAASGDPERIAPIARIVAPGAEPRWAKEAIADADLVVLSIPLHRVPDLDPAPLAGKIVIDGMNYWPPVDGVIPVFEDAPHGSSSVVQDLLTGSRVVKTFNHTGYHDLEPDRRPPEHPERLGLAVAG